MAPLRTSIAAVRPLLGIALFAVLAAGHDARAQVASTSGSAGSRHSCALTTSGDVKCWGANGFGQLGAGGPGSVALSGAVSVSSGDDYTCAVTTAGGVKCWGYNGQGVLGDGTTTDHAAPADVSGLTSGVVSVSAGMAHACAVLVNGHVKCWGNNPGGELGNGSTTDSLTPVDVVTAPAVPLTGIASVSAGGHQTCAVTQAGAAVCWGANNNGELGDGSGLNQPMPVGVFGLGSGVASISAGRSHTCALLTDATVRCWGIGPWDSTTTPEDLGVSGATAIASANFLACVIKTNGVLCGGANASGQVGDGTTTNRTAFVPVVGLAAGAASIFTSADSHHVCVVDRAGAVRCWGLNSSGEIGDGTTNNALSPVFPTGYLIDSVASISAGYDHSCAVMNSGALKCWGNNNIGQLGDGTTAQRLTPVTSQLAGVKQVATGDGTGTCALTVAGGVKCWGAGPLGNGTNNVSSTPVDVTGLTSGVTAIAMGNSHVCAVINSGVKCWGGNFYGEMGDGTQTTRLSPVDVSGLGAGSGVTGLVAGDDHTCAVMGDGSLMCWGRQRYMLQTTFNPSPPNDLTPVVGMGGATGFTSLAAGSEHTCGVTQGKVQCGGNNGSRQGGTPIPPNNYVTGFENGGASQVGAGYSHSCAITTSGGLKCWGDNFYAEMGLGSAANPVTQHDPIDVPGLTSGVVAVDGGSNYNCALMATGRVKCWGYNNYGQVGNGLTGYAYSATDVVMSYPQSIFFTTPATITGTTTLSATSSSGLTVTFDGWTPSVCTVSGNVVKPIAVGLCGVRASQAGNGTSSAAPQVLQLITVPPSPPVITSANGASFGVGSSGSFSVTTTGVPLPAINDGGATLPAGVNFVDNGDGTATISGTPSPGSAGVYSLTITASNGVPPDATQILTLTVAGPPDITSANGATIQVGYFGSFVVTTTGIPHPAINDGGASLPGGVSFVDNGDGTATLSGTPDAGSRGIYSFTITASNGVGTDATQLFTLTIADQAVFTSPSNTTFTVGVPGVFNITAVGPPTPSITDGGGGSYPPGVGFVDNGDGSATISGTPAPGSGGVYGSYITASSGYGGFNTELFLLTVDEAPAITSANHVTFTAGSSGSFVVTTVGYPFAAISDGGASLPAGVTFVDNHDRTATLSGMPLAGSAGTYPFTITATNGIGSDATQSFTLTVNPPSVTRVTRADFNADGKGDIVWRNSTDGSLLQWLMNGTSVLLQTSLGGSGTTDQPKFLADFNGDGKADILWQDTDGTTSLTLMDGGSVISDTVLVGAGTGWSVTQVGDFNGDGKADLVWTHTSGAMQVWLMDGATAMSVASFVPAGSGWSVLKVADLDGDGKADIIWQHTDGTVQAWLMNGLTPVTLASFVGAGSGWTVSHAADLDGDGKQDLIWSNTNGSVQAWLMNGLTITQIASFVPAGAGYTATHTGDLNGDGKQDILWRYTDGTVIAWLMGPNLAVNQIASFTGTGNQYAITHTRDLNGDGKDDLLWRHPDGTVQAWLMNGLSVNFAAVLTGAGPYVVVPPMP